MNRGLVVAVAAVVLLGGAAYYLHRPRPVPKEVVTPTPEPRIVPKKVDPPAPVATPAPEPKKSAPKKAETPAPAAPAAPSAPKLASLQLESDVPGASVFIDRAFVGNTPLSLDKLEPGTKRVQLTATGFDSVQKTIELNPGPNTVNVRIKEVSLNAKTEVVHKHGMGSCEGALIATLDGLRYDTSNKGDAFNLPYAQVDSFAVDYLQKNLRVKSKAGKTWNFTDKNDNADKLFVFHRDVEAARKKLADGYARAQE
jgi:hypothetical protein